MANVAQTPVATPEPSPWDASFAGSLLTAHPHVPPAEAAAFAYQAGLPGVARCMTDLSGVTGEAVRLILAASS
jgi:hypothetical protein